MLSPYANSAVLASKAVRQTYKALLSELNAIHGGELSKVTRVIYNDVSQRSEANVETMDLKVLNKNMAEATNYVSLLKNIRIQQELIDKYGKGEMPLERVANICGLSLPVVPEHTIRDDQSPPVHKD